MIYLGEQDKKQIVSDYVKKHKINKVYSFGEKIGIENEENTEKKNLIEYVYYCRLLSCIRQDDLIVCNEILFTSKRADLTYNCIRHYLVQTEHRLIFNYFPFHNSEEDLAVLWDFCQNNPFLKIPFSEIDLAPLIAGCNLPKVTMTITPVTLSELQVQLYEIEKEKIFNTITDSPAFLPRRCLKASQKINPRGDNKAIFKPDGHYYESQLGVDHYFCDILRQKAAIMEKYNDR